MVEAKSERDRHRDAIGVDGFPILVEISDALGMLVLAANPLVGRDVGTPRSPSYNPATPGAATVRFRAGGRRVYRQLEHLLVQILSAVEEEKRHD